MANLPGGAAQFEFQKMQLISSLGAVAEAMRNCAAVADQFAQMVPYVPYNSAAQANGQFPIVGQAAATPQTGGKRKMRGGEDGEGKKQLRPKKPKDPNAPKRPASSYLLFQNDVRQELKAKNPALPNNELLGIISKMWKGMSDEDKETYELRHKTSKDQWLQKKAAYEGSPNQVAAVPTIAEEQAAPEPVKAASSASSSEEEDSEEEESASSSSEEEIPKPPPTKKTKKGETPAAATTSEAPIKEKKSRKPIGN
ncbi:hypothetical protein AcV7_007843 [Taiwanofungus camphoratus]|nr:hypothetical protein AcW2_006869 [Antrodia cinnamomea]KAI0951871.1 hypothetical protein AcV7_007843 [Antrodia cinnamomea]